MIAKAKAPEELHDIVFKLYETYAPKPCKVIDLGAGEGIFCERASSRDDFVVGVDYGNDWKLNGLNFLNINLDKEGFAREIKEKFGEFDVVVAVEIIEHLENPFAFVRECAKLLKPNGILLLTTPNVEAVNSRIMFLIKGRLAYFDEYSTIRSAHITPVFSWKLDMALEEAGFKKILDKYVLHEFRLGKHNLKGWIGGAMSLLVYPFIKGNKRGGNRVVVARYCRDERHLSNAKPHKDD